MFDKIIFHVDVNSAFLSWEAVHRITHLKGTVDLREIPSAIGGISASVTASSWQNPFRLKNTASTQENPFRKPFRNVPASFSHRPTTAYTRRVPGLFLTFCESTPPV